MCGMGQLEKGTFICHPFGTRNSSLIRSRIPSYGIKMAIVMYIYTGRPSHGEGLLSRFLYQSS